MTLLDMYNKMKFKSVTTQDKIKFTNVLNVTSQDKIKFTNVLNVTSQDKIKLYNNTR